AVNDFDEYADKSEEDGSYKATYKGPATDVFDVFEDVFNLSLTGFDREDETTMTVEASFDKDSLFMTALLIKIEAEADAGTLSMIIDSTFDDFGEAKVEVPQEVIDATE